MALSVKLSVSTQAITSCKGPGLFWYCITFFISTWYPFFPKSCFSASMALINTPPKKFLWALTVIDLFLADVILVVLVKQPNVFILFLLIASLKSTVFSTKLCETFDFQRTITLRPYNIFKSAGQFWRAPVSYLLYTNLERPIFENGARGRTQNVEILGIKKSNFVKFMVFKGP